LHAGLIPVFVHLRQHAHGIAGVEDFTRAAGQRKGNACGGEKAVELEPVAVFVASALDGAGNIGLHGAGPERVTDAGVELARRSDCHFVNTDVATFKTPVGEVVADDVLTLGQRWGFIG